MNKRLKKLQDRRAQLVGQMRGVVEGAEKEVRALTEEENAKYNAFNTELAAVKQELAQEEALVNEERSMRALPSQTGLAGEQLAESVTDLSSVVGRIEQLESNRLGGGQRQPLGNIKRKSKDNPFPTFGEFLVATIEAARPGGRVDERLSQPMGAASGGSTGVSSDGGFLVHRDFSTEIMRRSYDLGILASRCRKIPIGENADGYEAPYLDETSRATGSRLGGVRVYRRAEAATVAASKPKLGKLSIDLEDLMGIAYVTGRALRDATSLGATYSQAFSEEFAFVLDDEIYRGTGAGQCQGVKNAAAKVSQAKEAGQTADTVNALNIIKMWSRLWVRSRANAAWFVNTEVEAQLQQMTMGTGTANLVYMPPGGLSGLPYGTLFGRPVIPIEQADALGDEGDISLLDLSQYLLIDKDGVQADQSMHVRFLYDEMTFRFIMRVNGTPTWQSALTPYKGANTQSPFVTLADRA